VDHPYGEGGSFSGSAWVHDDDSFTRIPQQLALVGGGLETKPFFRELDRVRRHGLGLAGWCGMVTLLCFL
jgi:hypothetical protein